MADRSSLKIVGCNFATIHASPVRATACVVKGDAEAAPGWKNGVRSASKVTLC